jgi:cysteine-rich repeat protein
MRMSWFGVAAFSLIDGNTVDADGCSATCKSTEVCGNALLDQITGESCDDGNTVSGDGCSATCAIE